MDTLARLISRIIQLLGGGSGGNERRNRSMIEGGKAEVYQGPTAARSRNFDADYRAATKLLKTRMDKSFPDNYQARLSSGANSTYDHGEDRAAAVDTASAAIATALRKGATVQQAAEAGAASVGL
ncbi:hypothetical protein FV228_01555 [Methylobacterium sp. WL18]|uniref:hypothetical protein n=1 Tax=Methylobacterium sp. WL18 TaxID=2603897 RepID=UPI0011C93227|nr:hypothetical protein [Methylobacterium sp. WL18]TXN76075.1 hypothetical protein FV228_01555 [Methylobacterium sp. WL18]